MVSKAGGGTPPIEERGEPIELELSGGESTTVPDGVYWLIDAHGNANTTADGLRIGNNRIYNFDDGDGWIDTRKTVHENQEIQDSGGSYTISGWEVEYP